MGFEAGQRMRAISVYSGRLVIYNRAKQTLDLGDERARCRLQIYAEPSNAEAREYCTPSSSPGNTQRLKEAFYYVPASLCPAPDVISPLPLLRPSSRFRPRRPRPFPSRGTERWLKTASRSDHRISTTLLFLSSPRSRGVILVK